MYWCEYHRLLPFVPSVTRLQNAPLFQASKPLKTHILSIAFYVFIHNKHAISQKSHTEKWINKCYVCERRKGRRGRNVLTAAAVAAAYVILSMVRAFNSSHLYINNSIAALYNILIQLYTLFGVVAAYRFNQNYIVWFERLCSSFAGGHCQSNRIKTQINTVREWWACMRAARFFVWLNTVDDDEMGEFSNNEGWKGCKLLAFLWTCSLRLHRINRPKMACVRYVILLIT